MNRLQKIKEFGQSVWLDNLSRPLLTTGKLKRLIEEDGICGITSNPAIFHKAMTEGDAYDAQIRELALKKKNTTEVYESLAVKDIQDAADVLRPVFAQTKGADGFVSLEVSPHLASDTKRTLAEAQRLWNWVARPNVMIKIPGTPEGIPAIREALTRGINVNVTLLFSVKAYAKVIEAHIKAMEARHKNGDRLDTVSSVVSFFISRIDTKVDKVLDTLGTDAAKALRGKTALANAKLAYQLWQDRYSGDRWAKLAKAGARVQRPLWASTAVKDPAYRDVLYVEPLIGPSTVNTMPDETVDAFRDHGEAAVTVEQGVEEAKGTIEGLKAIGLDIEQVTAELVTEGVDKFIKPFVALLAALELKRKKYL